MASNEGEQALERLVGKFPGLLTPGETVIAEMLGTMAMMMSHAGRIVLTQKHFGFASNRGFTNRLLPLKDVRNVDVDGAQVTFTMADGTIYYLKNVADPGRLAELFNKLKGYGSKTAAEIDALLAGGGGAGKATGAKKKAKAVATSKPVPAGVDEGKLNALYEKYFDEDVKMIGPAGVGRFCEDLQLDPASIDVLLIAWNFDAKRMGFFTKDEFIGGCASLKADSLDTLKLRIADVEREIQNDTSFEALYKFTFQFCREEDQKSVRTEMALGMLPIIMGKYEHTATFVEFLSTVTDEYKVINIDQWTNFLEFCKCVKFDCSDYDDIGWPVLIDEYVDWKLSKKK